MARATRADAVGKQVTAASTTYPGYDVESSAGPSERTVPVTFLVPAWNAAHDVEPFVRSFSEIDLPGKQLILCAGGSDGTYDIAKRFKSPDILVIQQPAGMGKQGALRASYPLGVGDYFYLTDIDCRLNESVVRAMLDRLLVGDVSAVTGPIRPPAEQREIPFVQAQWSVERYLALRSAPLSTGLRGNNAVVTRQAVEDTGAFGQVVFSGTDYTMAKELLTRGHLIAYLAAGEMPSEFPDSLRLYIRKQARWIRNVYVLGRQYGCMAEVRSTAVTMAIPFIYLLLVCLAWLSPDLVVLVVLLLIDSFLNRRRYARASRVTVTLSGLVKQIVGDLGASVLVAYQLLTKRFTW
ncbi:MAG: glycosyltransferase family 2 protein [Bacilli bacterium]